MFLGWRPTCSIATTTISPPAESLAPRLAFDEWCIWQWYWCTQHTQLSTSPPPPPVPRLQRPLLCASVMARIEEAHQLSASALFPHCAWGAFCHHAATLSGAYQPRSKTDLSQTRALSGQGKSDTVFEEVNLKAPAELEREEYCPLLRLNALPFMIFRRRHAASQRSTAHSAATCYSRPALGLARCSSALRPFSRLSHQLLSVNSLGLVSSALAPAQFACGRKLCAAGLAMVLNNPGFCCRLHVRHCRWWKIIPGKVESCSSW